jgi:hypothetical protein
MIEYIYKGFKISYKIILTSVDNIYKAEGSLLYLLSTPKCFAAKKFHAQSDTHRSVEYEIKKKLEDHVNFELKSFYATQKNQIEEYT